MVTSYNNDATIGAQMWDICGMEHKPDTALVAMKLKLGMAQSKIKYYYSAEGALQ